MDYFAFQERFRGSATAIKARQQPYVEYFRGREPVLDLGCGRGEFLELLKEAGVASRGIDSDASMVAYCRERGLPAEQGDLMPFLAGQPGRQCGRHLCCTGDRAPAAQRAPGAPAIRLC